MEHINIRSSQIGVEKRANCKFTSLQVLNLLMLFPFFVVKNACQYSGSALSHLFVCEKDMFYRFMNDGNVRWRKLLYAMNLQLIKKIQHESNVSHDKPVSLIIDDTDAPKRLIITAKRFATLFKNETCIFPSKTKRDLKSNLSAKKQRLKHLKTDSKAA